MEIDPRVLPPKNEEIDTTIQNEPKAPIDNQPLNDEILKQKDEEIESLKASNLTLAEQKKHWREKYDRDITNRIPNDPDNTTPQQDGSAINELRQELNSIKEREALKEVYAQYPAIVDKKEEFNEFREDYPGLPVDKLAKLFIAENNLGTPGKPRLGLETPTGGSRGATRAGMTEEEVKRLRETQPRRYQKMLQEGKIRPEDIH